MSESILKQDNSDSVSSGITSQASHEFSISQSQISLTKAAAEIGTEFSDFDSAGLGLSLMVGTGWPEEGNEALGVARI
jgi:hypothetical protein